MDDGVETLDEDMILSAATAYATDLQQVSAEPRTSQHLIATTVQFYVTPDDAAMYLAIDPDAESTASFDEGALLVKENLDADGNPDGFCHAGTSGTDYAFGVPLDNRR